MLSISDFKAQTDYLAKSIFGLYHHLRSRELQQLSLEGNFIKKLFQKKTKK